MRLVLRSGYEAELLRSPQIVAALGRAADHVAAQARAAAPRGAALAPGRRRHYADMISGVAGLDDTGIAVGRVNANHFTSLFVELGTVHNPPHAPLRKALDASRGRAL